MLGATPEKVKHTINIAGYYYFFKEVPKQYRNFEKRRHVKVSLKTKSAKEARKKAASLNEHYQQYWEMRASGFGEDAEKHIKIAITLAQRLGHAYRPLHEILKDEREILSRLATIHRSGFDKTIAKAVMGVTPVKRVQFSHLPLQAESIEKDAWVGKNKSQINHVKSANRSAVQFCTSHLGSRYLDEYTRTDALSLKEFAYQCAQEKKLTIGTLNRYLGTISTLFNKVNDGLRLGLQNPFSGIRLKDRSKSSRPAYPVEFIRDVLLNEEKLQGLNHEARHMIFALADTGARPIELCLLTSEQIYLHTPIPYIHIRENEHGTLKTRQSERKIPLVGAALYAFQQCPEGFPRYRGKHDSATTAINKYLRENSMIHTPKHSLYSLRHSFHDRMRRAGVPPDMQRQITGHAHKDIHDTYGDGYSLDKVYEWMKKITEGEMGVWK